MSIELPGFLTDALGRIGMEWPAADEDALFAAGAVWSHFAARLREVETSATHSAAEIWSDSEGPAVDAFRSWWQDNPAARLVGDADGAETIATLSTMFATATIALKGVYLVQLGILCATVVQAMATAAVTFGMSLLEIPVVTTIVRKAIGVAIDEMISRVLF